MSRGAISTKSSFLSYPCNTSSPGVNDKVITVSRRVAILVGEIFLEHAPLRRGFIVERKGHGVRDDGYSGPSVLYAGRSSKFKVSDFGWQCCQSFLAYELVRLLRALLSQIAVF